MRQYIKDTLVEMHRNVTTDKYGQVGKFNYTPAVFGDRQEEVMKYCRQHPGILEFSTYGFRYMTYRAFTIVDTDIRRACNEALRENKNYLENINSW